MQHISAREAKNRFGRLIDDAQAAPAAIDEHGCAGVVALSVEEYERLIATEQKAKSLTTVGLAKRRGE